MLDFLIGGLAGLGSAYMQGQSAKKAAKAQAQAAAEANRVAGEQYQSGLAMYQPYRESGMRALSGYEDSLGLNGADGTARSLAGFQGSADYLGAMKASGQAVDAGSAARGNFFSGAAGKALSDRAGQINNQYLGQYRAGLGNLNNQGFAATGASAGMGSDFAAAYGRNVTGAGDARARGILGQGEAMSAGLSGIAKLANYYQPWGGSKPSAPVKRPVSTSYGGTPSLGGYFG